jgi:hypothetical protein
VEAKCFTSKCTTDSGTTCELLDGSKVKIFAGLLERKLNSAIGEDGVHNKTKEQPPIILSQFSGPAHWRMTKPLQACRVTRREHVFLVHRHTPNKSGHHLGLNL